MRILQTVYGLKWCFDTGARQVAWATGKLPELMAVLYLAEKAGYPLPSALLPPLVIVVAAFLILLGFVWRHTGLYSTERLVETKNDPIMREVYTAALKTNKGRR